jgi:hypothetical protein
MADCKSFKNHEIRIMQKENPIKLNPGEISMGFEVAGTGIEI